MDIDNTATENLSKRISDLQKTDKAQAIEADYNDGNFIAKIIQKNNPNGLNLVFIDPTDCSVPFETIEIIKKTVPKVDFIINIATFTDFSRNVQHACEHPHSNVRKKYERFLGSLQFFSVKKILDFITEKDFRAVRREFLKEYERNLKKLGFEYMDALNIQSYYYLYFASTNIMGASFWKKACSITRQGQRELQF